MKTDRHIEELLNGGDWACSWAYDGGLATVCVELATLLGPELAARAAQCATDAHEDMRKATDEWVALTRDIRATGERRRAPKRSARASRRRVGVARQLM